MRKTNRKTTGVVTNHADRQHVKVRKSKSEMTGVVVNHADGQHDKMRKSNDDKMEVTATGGDMTDCLDAEDIDAVLWHTTFASTLRQCVHVWPARWFFDARTSTTPGALSELGETLRRDLATWKIVVMPTHIRHHWIATCWTYENGTIKARVYDSAPAECVRRDMRHMLSAMVGDRLEMVWEHWPKQHRNSNECGLFTIAAVLGIARQGQTAVQDWQGPCSLSLEKWRDALADGGATLVATHGKDAIIHLATLAPELTTWLGTNVSTTERGKQRSAADTDGPKTKNMLTAPKTLCSEPRSAGAGPKRNKKSTKTFFRIDDEIAAMQQAMEESRGAKPAKPATIAPMVRVVEYGVLGTAGNDKTRLNSKVSGSERRLAELPDTLTAITDPAGLNFIASSAKGVGGASASIYEWCGIGHGTFPPEVRRRVTKTGDAAAFTYGRKTVIHVCGPDFRVGEWNDTVAEDALANAYSNVLKEFATLEVDTLRLLPISGGVYSGKFGAPASTKMPHMTKAAIERAEKSLTPGQRRAISARTIELCIYSDEEREAYYKAFNQPPGSVELPTSNICFARAAARLLARMGIQDVDHSSIVQVCRDAGMNIVTRNIDEHGEPGQRYRRQEDAAEAVECWIRGRMSPKGIKPPCEHTIEQKRESVCEKHRPTLVRGIDTEVGWITHITLETGSVVEALNNEGESVTQGHEACSMSTAANRCERATSRVTRRIVPESGNMRQWALINITGRAIDIGARKIVIDEVLPVLPMNEAPRHFNAAVIYTGDGQAGHYRVITKDAETYTLHDDHSSSQLGPKEAKRMLQQHATLVAYRSVASRTEMRMTHNPYAYQALAPAHETVPLFTLRQNGTTTPAPELQKSMRRVVEQEYESVHYRPTCEWNPMEKVMPWSMPRANTQHQIQLQDADAEHDFSFSLDARHISPYELESRCSPRQEEAPREAAPLSTKQIKLITKHVREGEWLRVTWRRGSESGTWLGVIRGKRGSTLRIEYIAEFCSYHQAWENWSASEEEDDEEAIFDLPWQSAGLQYLEIEPITEDRFNIGPRCKFLQDDDEDEQTPENETSEDHRWELGVQTPADPLSTRFEELSKFYVFGGRPGHVHAGVWEAAAMTTRARHRSILKEMQRQAARTNLGALPLAQGVVEFVMRRARERKWRWSTIASTLSAAATALGLLPIYSTSRTAMHIKSVEYFKAALAHACVMARSEAARRDNDAMSPEQYNEILADLRARNEAEAADLLQLSWEFAFRVGDLTKVRPEDLIFDTEEEPVAEYETLRVRITQGKTVKWTGPFILCAIVRTALTKRLRLLQRARHGYDALFLTKSQSTLSKAVSAANARRPAAVALTIRAIRKGRLQQLSALGIKSPDLMLLSNHSKEATLRRYLGFGLRTGELDRAAETRAEAERRNEAQIELCRAAAAAAEDTSGAGREDPIKMGSRSGFGTKSGRRESPAPSLMPFKAASREDIGLPPVNYIGPELTDNKTKRLPLHTKKTGTVDVRKLVAMSHGRLRTNLITAARFLEDERMYGATWAPLTAAMLPELQGKGQTQFTAEDVAELLASGKIVRYNGVIKAGCNGWAIAELKKHRRRPVFEPLTNQSVKKSDYPEIHYPSRKERRVLMARPYFAETDCTAWYDQFVLQPEVQGLHVVKFGGETFALTRAPMGAVWSASLAQTALWCLLQPIIEQGKVNVTTSIDNVGFAAESQQDLREALKLFRSRCEACGVQLNPEEAEIDATEPHKFLGEEYVWNAESKKAYTRNAAAHVDKLKEFMQWMQNLCAEENQANTRQPTRRNVACAIGLVNWCAHTIGVKLCQHHALLKLFVLVGRVQGGWDAPWEITTEQTMAFGRIIGVINNNPWTEVAQTPLPPTTDTAYDATIVIDASATGYGGFARRHTDGVCVQFRAGWRGRIPHSAHAEPRAVGECLAEMMRNGFLKTHDKLAIITDHCAIVEKQQRTWSELGGCSAAYFLNEMFNIAHNLQLEVQYFWVAGEHNPADGPSRSTSVFEPWRMRRDVGVHLPPLCELYHPFTHAPPREQWHV